MPAFQQRFQNLPGDPEPLLDGLVRIGVRAQPDRLADVLRVAQFLAQQLRRSRLVEQPRFEIQAGREVEIGVRGPRETVDAAVFAAAIGIDGLIKRHVR